MSRPKPKYRPDPRLWSSFQVACFLNMSEQGFRDRREHLEERLRFPAPDPEFGMWDSEAVIHWLDARSGFPSQSGDQPWMEAIENGKGRVEVSGAN